jgi:hypothetical protein
VPMRRPIVALNIPRRLNDIPTYAQFIHDSMKKSPFFPDPPVPLATLAADIAALRAAQSVTLTRAKGTADDRNAKLVKVKGDLETLRVYVQTVAEFSPGNAAEIVLGAGMNLKKPGLFDKPVLRVKQGPGAGNVVVIAKAADDRASYQWQHSRDGLSWTDSPPTRQARTTLSGLAAKSLWYFRFRSLGKKGLTDWCDAVSFFVV